MQHCPKPKQQTSAHQHQWTLWAESTATWLLLFGPISPTTPLQQKTQFNEELKLIIFYTYHVLISQPNQKPLLSVQVGDELFVPSQSTTLRLSPWSIFFQFNLKLSYSSQQLFSFRYYRISHFLTQSLPKIMIKNRTLGPPIVGSFWKVLPFQKCCQSRCRSELYRKSGTGALFGFHSSHQSHPWHHSNTSTTS